MAALEPKWSHSPGFEPPLDCFSDVLMPNEAAEESFAVLASFSQRRHPFFCCVVEGKGGELMRVPIGTALRTKSTSVKVVQSQSQSQSSVPPAVIASLWYVYHVTQDALAK